MARPPQRKQANTSLPMIERSPFEFNAINDALRALDRAVHEMDRQWGSGRLVTLVTPELAARFGSARDKLGAAVRAASVDEVGRRAEVVARGLVALDIAARVAGHPRVPTTVWPINYEGQAYAVCAENEDAIAIAEQDALPGHVVLCLRELLLAWHMLKERQAIESVKATFPGATVSTFDVKRGDELPF